MAEISAAMVKQLRDRTSAGMMDCKKALQECNADLEAAVDWLRQKGLSKAANKAGRATSEGVVASRVADDASYGVIVEVMCETDFVTRGDRFQAFAKEVVDLAYDEKIQDNAKMIERLGDAISLQIATIGENISVGRVGALEVTGTGAVVCYVHATGKIGVLVEMTCTKAETVSNPTFQELGRNVAMQVAAASPIALESCNLDPAVVEREREVYRQKTLEEGKPADKVEQIVNGRIQKFYKEVCLVEQPYIRDDKQTIKGLLAESGKAIGDTVGVARFVRFQLGENSAE